MRLSELLNPKAVTLRLAARTKREALVELVQLLESAHGFKSQGEILDRVMRREAMMTTGIGVGIAIPHGKLPGLKGVVAVFGRSQQGIDCHSLDGLPTKLFFLLVAPEESAGVHLKALARVSRLLKDKAFRDRLLQGTTRATLYQVICEEDARL